MLSLIFTIFTKFNAFCWCLRTSLMKANAQTPLSDFVVRERERGGRGRGQFVQGGNCRKETLHISSLDSSSVHMCSTQRTLTLSVVGGGRKRERGNAMKCFKSTFQFAAKADEPADSAKVNGIKFICNYDMAWQSEGNAPRNPLAIPSIPFQCCHFTRLSKYLLRYFQMHFNVCALTTTTMTITKRRRRRRDKSVCCGRRCRCSCR